MTDYDLFLASKQRSHVNSGFNIKLKTKNLFPFQKWVVERSLSAGKYGVFSGTGTGKSRMQLTWSDQVAIKTGKPVLLLAPLGVGNQTALEAQSINIDLTNIEINNYEQLDNIDVSKYGGVALDEGSIIKNHEGAYRNLIIEKFKDTPYKSVWTATPSPKGDTVLSPFGGIGSEGFKAVEMDRKAIMFELKESYFDLMKKNMAEVVRVKGLKTIFDK